MRSGEARPRAAAWSIADGVPGTIAGALLSHLIGGSTLLIASGVVLLLVGLRTTLVTHWALGHIDWALAGEFAFTAYRILHG